MHKIITLLIPHHLKSYSALSHLGKLAKENIMNLFFLLRISLILIQIKIHCNFDECKHKLIISL